MPKYTYIEDGKEYECAKIGDALIPLKPLEPEEPTHDLDTAFTAVSESAARFLTTDDKKWREILVMLAMLLAMHGTFFTLDYDELSPLMLMALGVADAMFFRTIWELALDWRLRQLAKLFSMFSQKLRALEVSNPADKRITTAKRLALCMHSLAFEELRRREGLAPGKQG